MKTEAKVTSKGQVTIPLKVRKALGVRPGDKIVFEQNGKGITVRPARRENVFEKYRGTVDFGIGQGHQAVIDYVRSLRDPD
ncbi:MAG: AbrB/MazE/SpoVT family DNA-binding domain-containing protein [Acidobacteria bacterium]|nr:AbrB/MazE/SpoVT family DNA-binding domain-containing protein [Acidobacteriota bacterium]